MDAVAADTAEIDAVEAMVGAVAADMVAHATVPAADMAVADAAVAAAHATEAATGRVALDATAEIEATANLADTRKPIHKKEIIFQTRVCCGSTQNFYSLF